MSEDAGKSAKYLKIVIKYTCTTIRIKVPQSFQHRKQRYRPMICNPQEERGEGPQNPVAVLLAVPVKKAVFPQRLPAHAAKLKEKRGVDTAIPKQKGAWST